MLVKFAIRFVFGLAFMGAMATYSVAQSSLIHADLPLWDNGDGLWPRGFSDDESFGCTGPLKFGDWKATYFPESEDEEAYTPDAEFLNIYNYGVMHCAYGFQWADSLDEVSSAEAKLGHLVEIGKINTPRGVRKLWVIQQGFRPGSSYILLASEDNDLIRIKFEILPMNCPKPYERDAGTIGIFMTRYCSINDKASFKRFAKRMAKLEPVGTLEFLPNEEVNED